MQADNYGHMVLNDAPCPAETTIAVTGMGRSGTTMVARILLALGLPIARGVTSKFLEEKQIIHMLKNREMEAFAALCAERNANHPRWAFKCPTLRVRLKESDPILRNPRYIVTYRDVVAVSSRVMMQEDIDTAAALEAQARKQYNLMRSLLELSNPVLLLSYEKSMRYPEHTVSLISEFCGEACTKDQISRIAANEIRFNDPRYLVPDAGDT